MRTSALIVALLTAAAVAAAGEEPTYSVLIEYRAANTGAIAARECRLIAEMPLTNRYQKVLDLRLYPEPDRREPQKDGSTLLEYDFAFLPEGGTYAVRMLAILQPLTPVSVDLTRPAAPGTVEPLDLGAIPATSPFLSDHELCRMTDPTVVAEAERLAKSVEKDGRVDRADYARACYDCLAGFTYDRDDRYDPAPTVLARRRGSCTELAFAFLALCRTRGIPTRVVGGFVARSAGEPSIDSIGHRWPEFYDPRYGWVPVDPARGGGWREMAGFRYFGYVNVPGLVFIQPGSGSSPVSFRPAAVRYKDRTELRLMQTAYWQPTRLSDAQLADFEQRLAKLRSFQPAIRRGVLRNLDGAADALDCALLVEGLFDHDVQNQALAAKVLASARTPQAVFALLRSLQIVSDPRRRGQMLDALRTMVTRNAGPRGARVIRLLGDSRRPEAAEVLAGFADDKDAEMRRHVGMALVPCRSFAVAREAIEKLLADRDESVRLAVAVRMTHVREPAGYAAVLPFLEHAQYDRRAAAVDALRWAAETNFGYDPLANDPKGNAAAIAAWKAWAARQPTSTTAPADADAPAN